MNEVKIAPSTEEVPKDKKWYALELSETIHSVVRWNGEQWQYMIMQEGSEKPLDHGLVDSITGIQI